MPLQATSGAASYDGFGGGVAAVPNYIEDVFSTYLYTGTGSGVSQTITNGIDLSTKGGLVWIKDRNSTASGHGLWDTIRGAYKFLVSSSTGAQVDASGSGLQYGVGSFNTNGFTLPTPNQDYWNVSGTNYASWTFRKQPKFFDVVTYTGDGAANKVISHNLQSRPGFIVIKCTSTTSNWFAWHRLNSNDGSSNSATAFQLNGTGGYNDLVQTSAINSATIDVTVVQDSSFSAPNVNGATYVAYLFAHNAGGFGLTGTDNVISCGSFTANASGIASINLGYEPQWLLVKCSSTTDDWILVDDMRGFFAPSTGGNVLRPNLSNAEASNYVSWYKNSTGFSDNNAGGFIANATYIYIAIRRGPMKVPTDATKVFSPVSQVSHGTVTTNFPVDLTISTLNALGDNRLVIDRLRGSVKGSSYVPILETNDTVAEQNFGSGATYYFGYDNNTGYVDTLYNTGFNIIYWNMRRAPGFFDEVCYTGNGTAGNISHNLGATPELIIFKCRSTADHWYVWSTGFSVGDSLFLDLTNAKTSGYTLITGSPTSTTLPLPGGGSQYFTNYSGQTYVAYLFATCAGVSKVGSYTGTGATQTISCGFTGGARFVLIKRTDSTGNWYVWDTARGMVAGTDFKLALNLTTADSNTNWVYTTTGGFQIVTTDANVNASGGTYIFLAIA